jgi:nucleoside-diphosphate-sugar epimerase
VTDTLIVGGGWVGGAIARAAAEHGRVAVIDLPTEPWLADRDDDAAEKLRRAVDDHGAGAVINAVGRLRGTEEDMNAANVAFPTWLFAALEKTEVRIVHIGSAGEYGDPGSADPIPETATPAPAGLYGTTKWAGTQAALAARERGADLVVARGFNILGSGMPPGSPVHQFLVDIEALGPDGGELEIWEPRTLRDYIRLDDLAAAMAGLAHARDVPDIVNVCSGTGLLYGELATALAEARSVPITIRSREAGGIMAVVGDNSRLGDTCHLHPEMSLDIAAAVTRL